ncbi:MAG: hypothetical protein NTW78_12520 [Campylobacterales bacterium]|nr:hypothetical protein [Campylobacterales bacterium]
MNFDDIRKRNLDHIQYCIDEYGLKMSIDDILAFANVYAQSDLNRRTIRLIGETKGSVDQKVKYTKVVLFSLTQKYQNFITEEVVNKTFQDFSLIAPYHTQLKYMNKIEELEGDQVKTCLNLLTIFADRPVIKI